LIFHLIMLDYNISIEEFDFSIRKKKMHFLVKICPIRILKCTIYISSSGISSYTSILKVPPHPLEQFGRTHIVKCKEYRQLFWFIEFLVYINFNEYICYIKYNELIIYDLLWGEKWQIIYLLWPTFRLFEYMINVFPLASCVHEFWHPRFLITCMLMLLAANSGDDNKAWTNCDNLDLCNNTFIPLISWYCNQMLDTIIIIFST
jgi:hypothetical protein